MLGDRVSFVGFYEVGKRGRFVFIDFWGHLERSFLVFGGIGSRFTRRMSSFELCPDKIPMLLCKSQMRQMHGLE